jgi:hypothetical protein
VDGETRQDEIERTVGERQRTHVAGFDRHTFHDALDRGVASRHVAGVARLIPRAPQIDASRAA